MKVNINNKTYFVKFHHTPNMDEFENPLNRTTHCHIFDGEKLVASGYAMCHEKDNFNKSIGRMVALKRAIGDFSVKLNCDGINTAFYDAYNKHHKMPLLSIPQALSHLDYLKTYVNVMRGV